MALVVEMIRRTSTGKAKNGITAVPCRRHDMTIAGYLPPVTDGDASRARAAVSASAAREEIPFGAAATALRSL